MLSTDPVFAAISNDATCTPLSDRLLDHVQHALTPPRRAATKDAYRAMPRAFFRAMEREIAYTMAASGQSLDDCLADLDTCGAQLPDSDDERWNDQPRTSTCLHLGALQLGFARRRCLKAVAQIVAQAPALQHVFAVGGGSASLVNLLADVMPSWYFTLVERTAAAQRFTRSLQRERGMGGRVRCLQGDLVRLPAEDASTDIVAVAPDTLARTSALEAGVAELLRVLRPGGWLSISLPLDDTPPMRSPVFTDAASALAFFEGFGVQRCAAEVIAPDPALDAIVDTRPQLQGYLSAVFRKAG